MAYIPLDTILLNYGTPSRTTPGLAEFKRQLWQLNLGCERCRLGIFNVYFNVPI